MTKVYKAHILYTKEQSRFEVLENGYVAVDAKGCVSGVATDIAALGDTKDAEIIDFGDRLKFQSPGTSSHSAPPAPAGPPCIPALT